METKNTKGWSAKEENKQAVNPSVKKIHNLLIVDESGSMRVMYNAALNGMNQTLETIRSLYQDYPQQSQEVTLVTFDTMNYKKIFDSKPIMQTHSLRPSDYNPCGGTPLYDAMGKALTELEPRVKENEAVLVTIITDGYENASCEYTLSEIKALVERLDKAGWVFSYIGGNQDSEAVGKSMGIQDTLNYDCNEESMKEMWGKERVARQHFSHCMSFDCASPKSFKRGSLFKNKE